MFQWKRDMMLCRIVISNFTNAIKAGCQLTYTPLRARARAGTHIKAHARPPSQYESPSLTLPKGVVFGCRLCVMNRYLQAMRLVWVIKYQQSGDKRNLSQLPPRYISDLPVGLALN